MSQLTTIMANTGLPAFKRVLGDTAVYIPPYVAPAEPAPVTTWCILRTRNNDIGEYGAMLESVMTAQLPTADIAYPRIGSTLTVNSIDYRIDRIIGQSDYFSDVVLLKP